MTEINDLRSRREGTPLPQVNLLVRIAFNPNATFRVVHQCDGHH